MITPDTSRALLDACERAGIDTRGVEPVSPAEPAVYRVGDGVVARVSHGDRASAVRRDVRVARWLERSGVAAARVVAGIDQPVDIGGLAVTFWREPSANEVGDCREVATTLRRLHGLVPPDDLGLSPLDPFDQVRDRVTAAMTISIVDRFWLLAYLEDLMVRYHELRTGLPSGVVHGDIRTGIAESPEGTGWRLDLEQLVVGPPEWDLTAMAVWTTSFGWLDRDGYDTFCAAYGDDVTTWSGFQTMRDIHELRACVSVLPSAQASDRAREEATYRVACLRRLSGPRPWRWRELA